MRPYKIQYFLAHGTKIAAVGGALILGAVVAWTCGDFSFWGIVAVLAALALGAILGMLFLWPLILVVCSFLNGQPFREGDWVRILVGPHRDRVVRVYQVWKERDEVRVELGEQEAKDVKDVFSNVEVCRERDA